MCENFRVQVAICAHKPYAVVLFCQIHLLKSLSIICCTHLKIHQGSLGEVKIKMSKIKKALPSHPQRCAWDKVSFEDVLAARLNAAAKPCPLLPRPPTDTLTLSTRPAVHAEHTHTRTHTSTLGYTTQAGRHNKVLSFRLEFNSARQKPV